MGKATDDYLSGKGSYDAMRAEQTGGASVDTGYNYNNSNSRGSSGSDYTVTPSSMKSSMDSQLNAQTKLYNQQAKEQAAKIRQAIESQTLAANNTKDDYTNQMNDAITTLNTERAKIPGQTTTLNNTASSQGVVNAQHIRNALSQMGLLQSGESASQQLLNDTTVANNINANNLQGQELDTSYGNQIASAQTDLASKVKQINDAISLAQSQGDENSLLILKDAQAKIADATATNATNYNNWAYSASQDAIDNRLAQQQVDATAVQNALDNVYRQSQADLAAKQWQSTFDTSNSQWDKNYALQQQQLAADQAYKNAALAVSKAKASSSGSSTKSVTQSSQQGIQNNYDAQTEVDNQIRSGVSPGNVAYSIEKQRAQLAKQGINVNALIKYVYSSAGIETTPGEL